MIRMERRSLTLDGRDESREAELEEISFLLMKQRQRVGTIESQSRMLQGRNEHVQGILQWL